MTEGERIQKIEDSIERLASDAESEKDTRRRRNEAMDALLMQHALKIDRQENSMSIIIRVAWVLISIVASLVTYALHDMITKGN